MYASLTRLASFKLMTEMNAVQWVWDTDKYNDPDYADPPLNNPKENCQ